MTQLIGIALVLALTLAVRPALVWAQSQTARTYELVPGAMELSNLKITFNAATSLSSVPPAASAYAPGHGATPPGQGGTPPGQAKPAEPDLDEADATGVFGNDILAFN